MSKTNKSYRKASGKTRKAVRLAMKKLHPNPYCHYCSKSLDWNVVYTPSSSREEIYEARKTGVTLDHIIPAIKGGKHTSTNMVIACQACNETRGYTSYRLFKFLRKYLSIEIIRFFKRNSPRKVVLYRLLKLPHSPERNKMRLAR